VDEPQSPAPVEAVLPATAPRAWLTAAARRLRGSPNMIPITLGYLLAVSLFLIWRGISVSPDLFIVFMLLAAVALGRWRSFVVDWIPFVVLFLGYEFLRGLAGSSGIPVHYREVIDADRLLGLGTVPTLWLQSHLHASGQTSALDVAATVVYFMHFAYPLTLGYGLWLRDRAIFRRFAAALLGMSFFGFLVFLLVPVAPPWLAAAHGDLPRVIKIIDGTVATAFTHGAIAKTSVEPSVLPSYTTWYYQHLNPDPVAAFPSLHAAFPMLGMLYAVRAFGRIGWLGALWVLAVCFSIVYLGEHYLVDALGGIVLAVAAFAVGERVLRPPVEAV
jgi:membrane-associated phospholipid phosphatase